MMATSLAAAPRSTVGTVRALVMHGLLFVLLMIFTSGLAALISSALSMAGATEADSGALPMALAATVVAGPLAWVLWRALVPRLAAGQAGSLIYSIQAALVYLLGLGIGFSTLCTLLGRLAGGSTVGWQSAVGTAAAWGLLWMWQHRVLRSARLAPTRLPSLGWVVGCYWVLLVAALSLASLLRTAVAALGASGGGELLPSAGPLAQLANLGVWVLLGAVAWAWHWFGLGVRVEPGALAQVMLVAGVAAAFLAGLLGLVFVVEVLLPLHLDTFTDRLADRLPVAAGFALSGSLVWAYLAGVLGTGGPRLREAGRQVLAGISLAVAATGFGMVINALLATFSPSLSGNHPADLLRVGLALLLCGLLPWLFYWRPGRAVDPEARKVYLVVFFGASAVVALGALLALVYQIFDYYLGTGPSGTSLLGEIRAPLGLLLATAAVFAYHFALWRADREALAHGTAGPPSPAAERTPAVLLVTDAAHAALAEQLAAATGLPVQHLRQSLPAASVPELPLLVQQLQRLPQDTARVLVIAEGAEPRLIPLH
ncbi:DUF5671 domain-containing protein [Glutamicibacter creatinolyticus]|uniref:DUF5671 domain-containing protein n=1 Tax=Glutamicibacter creatinolyticus TaxID=162496 RepID=UPI0037C0118E